MRCCCVVLEPTKASSVSWRVLSLICGKSRCLSPLQLPAHCETIPALESHVWRLCSAEILRHPLARFIDVTVVFPLALLLFGAQALVGIVESSRTGSD
jgi:hypothetical protein